MEVAYDTKHLSVLKNVTLSALDERIRREMRNREVHTPPISVFRWWARRSHTVFGSLLDAAEETLGCRLVVVDPFAGGGTTVLEAARRSHQVYGQDINPWAARGMRAMLSLADISAGAFAAAADQITERMLPDVGRAYQTAQGWTTHIFRVATLSCPRCTQTLWLYPYALLTLDTRKPGENRAWFGCRCCGAITRGTRSDGATCHRCDTRLLADQTYLPERKVWCPSCNLQDKISSLVQVQPLQYRIALVERADQGRRWFDLPTPADLAAAEDWPDSPLPTGEIPWGKETAVLRRHGFEQWRDLYPLRQRAMLTRLLDAISQLNTTDAIREVLTVIAAGIGEMAGLSSRWDRFYLKSYEVTANHRYAFAPFTAEPNVWGHEASGRGTFIRRLRQVEKAIAWFAQQSNAISAPYAGRMRIVEGSSRQIHLANGLVDLVLTDPPYFGDVQYGELSGVFRSWLDQGDATLSEEVVVDGNGKDGAAYTDLLADVFTEARRVLKDTGRLILTFHNRTAAAFVALGEALQRAGFSVVSWRWVASENERDFAKRDKTACTMDLVLECAAGLVPVIFEPDEPDPQQVEAHFLWTAGRELAKFQFCAGAWASLEKVLRSHPFVAGEDAHDPRRDLGACQQ